MSTKVLDLSNIGWPDLYVRTEPNAEHVADLRDVVKASPKSYPFDDPIIVRQLDKPAKYKVTMAGKGGSCEFELVQGLHRCLALQLEKVATVTAEVGKFANPGDAYFAQYDNHSVCKLTLPERAAFIKTLRATFKWTLDQIGKEMRLSSASISRILRGQQATKGRKGGGRKKSTAPKGDQNGQETAEETFNASEWFTILRELVDAAQEHMEELKPLAKSVEPELFPHAGDILTMLADARS